MIDWRVYALLSLAFGLLAIAFALIAYLLLSR